MKVPQKNNHVPQYDFTSGKDTLQIQKNTYQT